MTVDLAKVRDCVRIYHKISSLNENIKLLEAVLADKVKDMTQEETNMYATITEAETP